jgi:hypothetical protein
MFHFRLVFWIFLAQFGLTAVQYFQEEHLPSPMKLMDGGRDSLYYVDIFNVIHPIFISNDTLIYGPSQVAPSPIEKFFYSTANRQVETYFAAMMENEIMLIEEDENKEIQLFSKGGLENARAFNMGRKPTNIYFLFKNESNCYIQRTRIGSADYNPIEIPPIDATCLFSYGGSVVLACTDGQVTVIRDTGDIFPQYSHNSTITYIDSYTEE